MPWLFLHFKDLILDLQTILLSDKCCLIIKAFGAFLYMGLAEREATSQCSEPKTLSALLAQPVAPSLLQQQPNKLQLWVNSKQEGHPGLQILGTGCLVIIHPSRCPEMLQSLSAIWCSMTSGGAESLKLFM